MRFLIDFFCFSGVYFWANWALRLIVPHLEAMYIFVKNKELEGKVASTTDTVSEGRGSERSERARTKAS